MLTALLRSISAMTGMAFLLAACAQHVEEDVSRLSVEDEAVIDALFVDYAGDRPGATVMIAKNDELVLCKGYGLAVVETAQPATCDTPFRIASVSKQFTAMAILKLIDDGRISFDSTLIEIFPDFPDYGGAVTVRDLILHESGLRDYGPLEETAREEGRQLTDADVLEYLKTLDSTFFEPGSQWSYSNAAYAVLAEIVAAVSGKPFPEFVRQEIFLPAGMDSAGFLGTDDLEKPAKPYIVDGETVSPNEMDTASAIMGDGGVYASARDFYGWHKALIAEAIVSPELHKAAYQPHSLYDIYGYGWFTPQDLALPIVEHGGASRGGFIAFAIHYPEKDITVAVFANRTLTSEEDPILNLRDRARSLLSIATDGAFPMPDPATLQ